MNIIILGPPGSGKGTQGKKIARSMGLFYFEAGKFSRDLSKINTRIKKIVESGELIPEKDMTRYVKEYLESEIVDIGNVLFDGFPRFVSQYEDLEEWLNERGSQINKVVFLKVSGEVVVKRLSVRRVCVECGKIYNLITNPPEGDTCECGGELVQRNDDKEDVIKERLRQYYENIEPMIDVLKGKDILMEVDGEKSIEGITEEILESLQK